MARISTQLKVVTDRLCRQCFAREWFLVHESSIMGWHADNNVILPAVDVCFVSADDIRSLGGEPTDELGGYTSLSIEGVPVRAWTPTSLDLRDSVLVTDCLGYDARSLEPGLVLETIHFSPDYELLHEQVARLAMIYFIDELTDEELSEFADYVRGD